MGDIKYDVVYNGDELNTLRFEINHEKCLFLLDKMENVIKKAKERHSKLTEYQVQTIMPSLYDISNLACKLQEIYGSNILIDKTQPYEYNAIIIKHLTK